mgnify:CR=1 FL=1
MAKFGNTSLRRLKTCDARIVKVFQTVVKTFDCTVLEGHRTKERQKELVAEGKSKTMKSKHLYDPSRAIDIAPYPIDWEDRERFTYFAGFVMGVASQLGIELRWGGDWDQDTEVKDNRFDDLVHFELMD